MAGGLPALLTVEEAARLLRIGRTKAYAMAAEWRATGGASGLPVIDLGGVLRVPVAKLEEVFGLDLRGAALERPRPRAAAAEESRVADVRALPRQRRRDSSVRGRAESQLDLFDRAAR
jgi:hypothetical protein